MRQSRNELMTAIYIPKNAAILPYLLAHLSTILVQETECWRKRAATNGRKNDSQWTPVYVAEVIC
jgi:hypothetical protein